MFVENALNVVFNYHQPTFKLELNFFIECSGIFPTNAEMIFLYSYYATVHRNLPIFSFFVF